MEEVEVDDGEEEDGDRPPQPADLTMLDGGGSIPSAAHLVNDMASDPVPAAITAA